MTVRSRWAIVKMVLSANSLMKLVRGLITRRDDCENSLSNGLADELVGGVVNAEQNSVAGERMKYCNSPCSCLDKVRRVSVAGMLEGIMAYLIHDEQLRPL